MVSVNYFQLGLDLEICFSIQAGKWLENPLLKVRSKDSRTTSLIATLNNLLACFSETSVSPEKIYFTYHEKNEGS